MPEVIDSIYLPNFMLYTGPEAIPSNLDPRLQNVLFRRLYGGRRVDPALSARADEVAVIARVTDPAEWWEVDEVRTGAGTVVGKLADGTWLVTGRVGVLAIAKVRALAFVRSLKGAQFLRPSLHATLQEIRASPELLPPGCQCNGAAGSVIGIIDHGCDFVHAHFRRPDGGTRLLYLWDHGGREEKSSPCGYGRLYTREEIDRALFSGKDPYQELGYGPFLTPAGTHGTHVMDIAAGGKGPDQRGVAPHADLIFVDVALDDIPWGGSDVTEVSLGDSVRLLEAVTFIFEQVRDRPCVVNVSLGTNGGPHDGTTLVEQGIDALVIGAPDRAVVVAGGNAFQDRIHQSGRVPPEGFFDLVWHIPENNPRHHEMELWYPGKDRFHVDLLTPGGTLALSVPAGEKVGVQSLDKDVSIFVSNRLDDEDNGDNVIAVFLRADVSPGNWTLRLRGDDIHDGTFHAWIERARTIRSHFVGGDGEYSIGSISCGRNSFVTGSYDAHQAPACPLSSFTSAGPTRDGRAKPEISAPGQDVAAAQSGTPSGVIAKSGTSMSAPALTGVIALVLAEARARGLRLSHDDLCGIIIASARRSPPEEGGGWHPRYGHGRLCAQAALASVIELAGRSQGG